MNCVLNQKWIIQSYWGMLEFKRRSMSSLQKQCVDYAHLYIKYRYKIIQYVKFSVKMFNHHFKSLINSFK